MKKLSINLLGILAIVLAIGSAFTTMPKKASTTFKDFVNSTHVTGTPTNTTINSGWLQEFSTATILDVSGRPSTLTVPQFNTWLTQHCPTPTTIICMVVEKYVDGTLQNPNNSTYPTVYNGTFQ